MDYLCAIHLLRRRNVVHYIHVVGIAVFCLQVSNFGGGVYGVVQAGISSIDFDYLGQVHVHANSTCEDMT